MLLGLDVGGTFSDAVVIDGGKVMQYAKTPTTRKQLLTCVVGAIDQVLAGLKPEDITRVALSTTIVTNAIVADEIESAALVILPGPGVDIAGLLPVTPVVLPGYIDHRGREAAAVLRRELAAAGGRLSGYDLFAVSGKFSVRNPGHELQTAAWLRQDFKPRHITTGAELSGELNFWRRTNSAYYNAAVWPCFNEFLRSVEAALRQRGIKAPVYILKADGGTLPLAAAGRSPVEAIFTGPAASVLGVMALARPNVPAVSLDIGGTTTDIALWEHGLPVFSRKGAAVNGYPTAVRAFKLSSVGVGGDSHVRWDGDQLAIGPKRLGRAMALGGPEPTLSDALIVAGLAGFGDRQLAGQAMRRLGGDKLELRAMARLVVDQAVQQICRGIGRLIADWSAEPVYRVEDIVQHDVFKPELLIGVGGAAGGLTAAIADQMKIPFTVPAGSPVVNAAGAAVARPTLAATLRADTAAGSYTVAESGVTAPIPTGRFGLKEARGLTGQYLRERAAKAGIAVEASEIVAEEEFNIVRGFRTAGKILTCKIQIKPGVLTAVSGFSREVWQDG
ncbi:hydantoinase/oxoprolinase family protein|uniref:N-methylhydantoinase A/oxoprolinase/acetone carboxylase, beta subunit n=1 Tax=Dendrosporobacter quercicolus TaxID=146817 RepID=A0A1H0AE49_9FIRM|nr:hydantoinase/oxoprolinase family protein [Dendrosporobacter quercicolus]NSL50047.1 hydantoinase/oxoprolinase family protein [Dendrosporobacter quercicolus DSM 1736]SDN31273.1 N-methylhydantoinase A/oxoprolinase/acetone carboxylase, beta subunit [Dendrosporobacter quercicolus]